MGGGYRGRRRLGTEERDAAAGAAEIAWEEARDREKIEGDDGERWTDDERRWGWSCRNCMGGG